MFDIVHCSALFTKADVWLILKNDWETCTQPNDKNVYLFDQMILINIILLEIILKSKFQY